MIEDVIAPKVLYLPRQIPAAMHDGHVLDGIGGEAVDYAGPRVTKSGYGARSIAGGSEIFGGVCRTITLTGYVTSKQRERPSCDP